MCTGPGGTPCKTKPTAATAAFLTQDPKCRPHRLLMGVSDLQVGVVGCGTMNTAIVRGLCTLDSPPRSVVVSPRNAEKAAALHEDFPSLVRVAADNQEVVDSSDTVFIGVLPKLAEQVLSGLRFEARHTVVSLMSTTPIESVRRWCAPVPAASVVRAIPLPPVAKHMGTTLVTPRHETIVSLFNALGTAVCAQCSRAPLCAPPAHLRCA
jgi:pyrroline-5-carboxylate reductase